MKVIKFPCDEKYATINNHVLVTVNLGGVTTSWERCIIAHDLGPGQSLEIELPSIIQLIVVIVFSAEDVHTVADYVVVHDDSGMAGPWSRHILAGMYDSSPGVGQKVVFEDLIGSLSKCETSENYH